MPWATSANILPNTFRTTVPANVNPQPAGEMAIFAADM